MDKARLDWLEERRGLVNHADRGPHVCIDDGRDGQYHVYGGTYREALDNAIREYVPYVRQPHEYPSLDFYAARLKEAQLAYETALLRHVASPGGDGQ